MPRMQNSGISQQSGSYSDFQHHDRGYSSPPHNPDKIQLKGMGWLQGESHSALQEAGARGIFSQAWSQPKPCIKSRLPHQGNSPASSSCQQPPQQTSGLSYLQTLFQLIQPPEHSTPQPPGAL